MVINPVWEAAMLGDVPACKLAKKSGSNMDEADQHGNTALHHAVLHRHPAVVHYLLTKADANPHQPNAMGNTALHLAAAAGDDSSVQYLLSAKVCIEAQNQAGDTALHLAALKGFTALLQCISDWARAQVAEMAHPVSQSC
eukprot:TRINITY_DN19458_c0_g1_i5.p1 TRINITY_DN19458_c0_g1~~TRINITY_DN19458_c0_g1_i5.p1  ORF type:complete len:141 (-),score=37.30 TRINITY_DN19458_c0_g1_i5:560-982(-)